MDSLIYILDEPTIGLHESEKAELSCAITDSAAGSGGNLICCVTGKDLRSRSVAVMGLCEGRAEEGQNERYA
jgi:ABC-type multidrug transport system ATPase subunit